MRILVGSTLIVALLAGPSPGLPSYTEKLYVNMKAAMEPDRPSTRKLTFVISGTQGEPVQWVAWQVRKALPDGKRTLTVFVEPENVRGLALLNWEPKEQPIADFLYVPQVRRVLKNPDLGGLPVLFSDLTFADIGPVRLGETQLTLLSSDQHASQRTLKVQEVPRAPRPYARFVTWFAVDSSLPIDREYYDATDAVVKTEHFEIASIDGVPVATRTRIEDKVDGGSTEMQVSEVRSDVAIPDTLFDPARLSQVVNDPFWQSLAAPAPKPPPPPPAAPPHALPAATPPSATAPPPSPPVAPPPPAPAAAPPSPPSATPPSAAAPPPSPAAAAPPPAPAAPAPSAPSASPPAAPPAAAPPPAPTSSPPSPPAPPATGS
jgi:hypothetical protein